MSQNATKSLSDKEGVVCVDPGVETKNVRSNVCGNEYSLYMACSGVGAVGDERVDYCFEKTR